MNRVHNLLCSSGWWARRAEHELVPFGVDGLDLGDDVLEIGPGFGATTRVLAPRVAKLSVLELDPGYCERLRRELGNGGGVAVTQGDATELPYPDGRFSAVLCFTMLHHIPSVALQDKAFSEIARVLRPGGTFAGTDSIGSGWLFKTIHIGDTLNLIDPDGLPARLSTAGFAPGEVTRGARSFRWRAAKP
jgi:ubiquinone/menaquinone biosynthesis C-methylase UbiE